MFIDGFVHQLPDVDPAETGEWLDSLDAVIDAGGRSRARYLLARLMERAREQGVGVPAMVSTDYINTIPAEQEPWFPGDEVLERRIRAYIRWNAMAMVDRSNHRFDGLGGHLSTFASAAGALRRRLQPLLPRQARRRLRRPDLLPGPRRAGHLRARLPRGPAHRGAARPLPPRGRRRRAPELPAPAPHARVLGVPDGVDGPRPAQRRLPGALQPLPAAPRDRRHERAPRSGRSSATARWTSPSRCRACRSPRASSSTT